MIRYLKKDKWSAYIVGALIGVLGWILFYTGHQFGTTRTIQKLSGIIIGFFSKSYIMNSSYYMQYFEKSVVDWQFTFVIGIFLGSLISSKLSKSKRNEYVPSLWKKNFGPSKIKRNIFAFIGGIILILGARLAGGCTSGHAISGGLQLSVSSWVFMLAVFAVGIPSALIIYKKS